MGIPVTRSIVSTIRRPYAAACLRRSTKWSTPTVVSFTPSRSLSATLPRWNVPTWPAPPMPQPPVGPSDNLTPGNSSASSRDSKSKSAEESFWHAWSTSPSFQAALTTVVGLGMVFGAGIGYLEWYKYHVLHRVGKRASAALELTDRLNGRLRRAM
jgi:hypothetical protein